MRTTVRTCAWIVLAFALTSVPAVRTQGQRDGRTVAPAPAGSGAIAGIVTVSDSAAGRPVRLANVVLIGAATGTLRVTSTDDAGAFAFTNLPADRYTVGASKLPYLGAVAGARRPARPGTAIALDAGQKRSDVAIRLYPAGSIAGTVYTEDGRPAARISVGLRQRNIEGPAHVVTPDGGPVQTDDRGQFRFFGLAPGEYFVTSTGGGRDNFRQLSDAEVDAALKGGAVAAPADHAGAPHAGAPVRERLFSGNDTAQRRDPNSSGGRRGTGGRRLPPDDGAHRARQRDGRHGRWPAARDGGGDDLDGAGSGTVVHGTGPHRPGRTVRRRRHRAGHVHGVRPGLRIAGGLLRDSRVRDRRRRSDAAAHTSGRR